VEGLVYYCEFADTVVDYLLIVAAGLSSLVREDALEVLEVPLLLDLESSVTLYSIGTLTILSCSCSVFFKSTLFFIN